MSHCLVATIALPQAVYHGAMQAAFETLQFDHLPGFLAGRSVGLLPARSYGSESGGDGGKSGDDRTRRSEEGADRTISDNKVRCGVQALGTSTAPQTVNMGHLFPPPLTILRWRYY